MSQRATLSAVIVGLVPTIHPSADPVAKVEKWTLGTSPRVTTRKWSRLNLNLAKAAIFTLLTAYALPAKADETCEDGRLIPAQYEEREVEVIREAHRRLYIVPETYKTIDRKIILEEARCPNEALKTVTTFRVNSEPMERMQIIPTIFKIITDETGRKRQVVKQPASTTRVAFSGYPPRVTMKKRDPDAANKTCAPEDMIPAVTKTIPRRVVDTPASVKSEEIPEATIKITEKVLIAPARCERED